VAATCVSLVQVARGAALFLFYPLLSSGLVGYPMDWRTALFMTWAGLRGRVSVDHMIHACF
jgi:NhaP-type Na+/H+ or K+/H+ antiporter